MTEKTEESKVMVLPISQATSATFTDLYIKNTSLFFIENGSKRAEYSSGAELIGQAGDVMVFPPDSIVTMENRTWSGKDYRAIGVAFEHELVEKVFPDRLPKEIAQQAQIISPSAEEREHMLSTIKETLADTSLPKPVLEHRLLEPLVWLKAMGVKLSPPVDNSPLGKVRALIETDLTHPWRSREVADHFAMSEATMRRWLAQSGGSFSKILSNTRLERGLTLLQTTEYSVSTIALDCGFKTPSHFSESFKTRFGIQPKLLRSAGK